MHPSISSIHCYLFHDWIKFSIKTCAHNFLVKIYFVRISFSVFNIKFTTLIVKIYSVRYIVDSTAHYLISNYLKFKFTGHEMDEISIRWKAIHKAYEGNILWTLRRRGRWGADHTSFGEIAAIWRETDSWLFRRRRYLTGGGWAARGSVSIHLIPFPLSYAIISSSSHYTLIFWFLCHVLAKEAQFYDSESFRQVWNLILRIALQCLSTDVLVL